MIKLIDVSDYQVTSQWNALPYEEKQLVIIKATEGKSYKCKRTFTHYSRTTGIAGFYHYARPDLGNLPKEEADNFIETVKECAGYDAPVILALDWEGKSLDYSPNWALEWCDYVYTVTGIKPLIYMSQSTCKSMKVFEGKDYGLWVARFNMKPGEPGDVSPWKTWAIHQYGVVDNIDRDVFNGSYEQLEKYAGVIISSDENSPDVTNETCHCHMCEAVREIIEETMKKGE